MPRRSAATTPEPEVPSVSRRTRASVRLVDAIGDGSSDSEDGAIMRSPPTRRPSTSTPMMSPFSSFLGTLSPLVNMGANRKLLGSPETPHLSFSSPTTALKSLTATSPELNLASLPLTPLLSAAIDRDNDRKPTFAHKLEFGRKDEPGPLTPTGRRGGMKYKIENHTLHSTPTALAPPTSSGIAGFRVELDSLPSFGSPPSKLLTTPNRPSSPTRTESEEPSARSPARGNTEVSVPGNNGTGTGTGTYSTPAPRTRVNPPPAPSKRFNPCNCKKSKCLKLYCECFTAGRMCGPECNCSNCCNTKEHDEDRKSAIAATLERNPHAFKPKIETGGRHMKGCHCKKSGCLKKYCECFQAGITCGKNCKCVGCKNYANSPSRIELMESVSSTRKKRTMDEISGGESDVQTDVKPEVPQETIVSTSSRCLRSTRRRISPATLSSPTSSAQQHSVAKKVVRTLTLQGGGGGSSDDSGPQPLRAQPMRMNPVRAS